MAQYEAELPLFGGLHIWKANPVIAEALENAGRLLSHVKITHSYPHCWRHKTPVIYRAAAQWFVRMDEGEGLFTQDKRPEDACGRPRSKPSTRRASIPRTAVPACAT